MLSTVQSDVRMMTLASEAEKMDENEKKVAPLVTKELKEQLVPEMVADLVFIDDVTLLNQVSAKLKPAGFVLAHSSSHVPEVIEGLAVVSKKILEEKTLTLFRKVTRINILFPMCKLNMPSSLVT